MAKDQVLEGLIERRRELQRERESRLTELGRAYHKYGDSRYHPHNQTAKEQEKVTRLDEQIDKIESAIEQVRALTLAAQ